MPCWKKLRLEKGAKMLERTQVLSQSTEQGGVSKGLESTEPQSSGEHVEVGEGLEELPLLSVS